MKFDEKTVAKGLDSYQKIMAMVQFVDVSTDVGFQRLFKGFYKLRQKSASFYDAYFSFFEEHKRNVPSFRETIQYLYEKTHQVHFSFSSKLIATLDPTKPILDKNVMKWMGFQLMDSTEGKPEERINYYCSVYEAVEEQYNKHLLDKNIVDAFSRFDRLYPQFSAITKVKKLDCFLYTLGDGQAVSILDYNHLLEG